MILSTHGARYCGQRTIQLKNLSAPNRIGAITNPVRSSRYAWMPGLRKARSLVAKAMQATSREEELFSARLPPSVGETHWQVLGNYRCGPPATHRLRGPPMVVVARLEGPSSRSSRSTAVREEVC